MDVITGTVISGTIGLALVTLYLALKVSARRKAVYYLSGPTGALAVEVRFRDVEHLRDQIRRWHETDRGASSFLPIVDDEGVVQRVDPFSRIASTPGGLPVAPRPKPRVFHEWGALQKALGE